MSQERRGSQGPHPLSDFERAFQDEQRVPVIPMESVTRPMNRRRLGLIGAGIAAIALGAGGLMVADKAYHQGFGDGKRTGFEDAVDKFTKTPDPSVEITPQSLESIALITQEMKDKLEKLVVDGQYTRINPTEYPEEGSFEHYTIATWGSDDAQEALEVFLTNPDMTIDYEMYNSAYVNGENFAEDVILYPGVTDLYIQKEYFGQTDWDAWFYIPTTDVKVYARTTGNTPVGYNLHESQYYDGSMGLNLNLSLGADAITAARDSRKMSTDGTKLPKRTNSILSEETTYNTQLEAFPQVVIIPNEATRE